jgi:hypothetical protein
VSGSESTIAGHLCKKQACGNDEIKTTITMEDNHGTDENNDDIDDDDDDDDDDDVDDEDDNASDR